MKDLQAELLHYSRQRYVVVILLSSINFVSVFFFSESERWRESKRCELYYYYNTNDISPLTSMALHLFSVFPSVIYQMIRDPLIHRLIQFSTIIKKHFTGQGVVSFSFALLSCVITEGKEESYRQSCDRSNQRLRIHSLGCSVSKRPCVAHSFSSATSKTFKHDISHLLDKNYIYLAWQVHISSRKHNNYKV